MKSTSFPTAHGFQDVSPAELTAVEGGGKIAFTLGRIGITIGQALGGDAGGAVGWSIGTAIGNAVESVVNVLT